MAWNNNSSSSSLACSINPSAGRISNISSIGLWSIPSQGGLVEIGLIISSTISLSLLSLKTPFMASLSISCSTFCNADHCYCPTLLAFQGVGYVCQISIKWALRNTWMVPQALSIIFALHHMWQQNTITKATTSFHEILQFHENWSKNSMLVCCEAEL